MAKAKETPHITAVRRQWELNRRAAKMRAAARPADDLETVLARARAEEIRSQLKNPKIGQFIEGHGIFFGTWEPKDRDGKSLGKIFNLFATPRDLMDDGLRLELDFNEAVKRVSEIKGLCGHDGGNFANDKALLTALKTDGGYNGEWFLPPLEILVGRDRTRAEVQQENNLYHNMLKGSLAGTFAVDHFNRRYWYWSCTENLGNPAHAWNARMTDGDYDCNYKNNNKLFVRPVRVELRR